MTNCNPAASLSAYQHMEKEGEMKKFYGWLEAEYAGIHVFLFFLLLVFASVSIYLLLGKLFNYPFMWGMIADVSPYSTLIIAKNSFGEEAIFRLVPFIIFFKLFNKKSPLLIVLIVCSAAIHAYTHFGQVSLMTLTLIFILFALAYLKLGGIQNRHTRAFLFLGAAHTTTNVIIHVIGTSITHWNIQWL